jgi:molybdopterin converting factor small subunit
MPRPITVLYFASIRTHLSIESETFPQSAPTTLLSHLKAEIIARHPDDRTKEILSGCMWSVGDEMVDDDDENVGGEMADVEVRAGEVVAVIPPVSGG